MNLPGIGAVIRKGREWKSRRMERLVRASALFWNTECDLRAAVDEARHLRQSLYTARQSAMCVADVMRQAATRQKDVEEENALLRERVDELAKRALGAIAQPAVAQVAQVSVQRSVDPRRQILHVSVQVDIEQVKQSGLPGGESAYI